MGIFETTRRMDQRDEDEMTSLRREDLRRRLQARRLDLQRELDVKLRNVRTLNDDERGQGGGADEGDSSSADLQQDLDIALIEMRAEVLGRVQDALARLERGTYGYCAECSSEIAENRLDALPFAVRCRECEEARENADQRSRRLLASDPAPFRGPGTYS
jgi:RNA polymerase-binding transcription factor